MKIGIDARLLTDNKTGIGTYTNRLITELAAADKENQYVLYTDKEHEFNMPDNFSIRLIPQRRRILWTNLYLPWYLSADNIDIFHSVANFEVPIMARCKIVVTIHDLIPLLYPELVPFRYRVLFRTLIKKAAERSKKVLTVSHSSKKDIIELLGINSDRVVVIYEAGHTQSPSILDKTTPDQIRERFKLCGRYILFVGVIEPKKNIPTLIKAFKLLKRNGGGGDIKLVIAGGKGWFYDQVFTCVEELGLKNEVIFTGFVSKEDLYQLYNGAELFVFPSLYEGFGLPPLEAMACGTPVVCSNTGSLPEVVGDAGIFVDPMDLNGWVEAMRGVLNNPSLQARMVEKGLERAKQFSWKKTAEETLKVYHEVFHSS